MPTVRPSTGLAITDPLVLYRSLLATKRIDPDTAQYRLALHLQKLYNRLVDYEPTIEYGQRIRQLTQTVEKTTPSKQLHEARKRLDNGRSTSMLAAYRAHKEKEETMALTRKLTDHESATQIQSPQGLLLYGEVGTGKSMLVDLFAECLPSRKKRRWHFNTFMLEIFSRLEQVRKSHSTKIYEGSGEPSLVLVAKDLISTSPIIFLDEFQLPDRSASKILSNLLTSFFHLGGVLIATSNRMPEELANASGIEFIPPPSRRLGLFGSRWSLLGSQKKDGRSETMFSGKSDFAAFLDVLRSRCEIFEMEGAKDWRRQSSDDEVRQVAPQLNNSASLDSESLEPVVPGSIGLGYEQTVPARGANETAREGKSAGKMSLPMNYIVASSLEDVDWESAILRSFRWLPNPPVSAVSVPWQNTSLRVYGRTFSIPKTFSGVTLWSFEELCSANLGPADYITLASNFHTIILEGVPVLTLLQKNEARRLITLLDALYEARCKLLICAQTGPDDLFFPEAAGPPSINGASSPLSENDGVYPETFSEIYQDKTEPFRPNISAYSSSASSHQSARSILADEDSDFGPTYGAGRSRGSSDGAPGAGHEIGRSSSAPNFANTGIYTGEDERFAYKRARSRLWRCALRNGGRDRTKVGGGH